ncbi:MAG: hypothetical protein I3270_01070 [Candidatus Moeniiplasma glomeromycotorum]|nr:hypothetical protein [Candidatus Moeniiplasma glomeromycotorum]MCE8162302.1 hypothetical protein [Candidatus Moeniiplasma glomeromycotorum]MCE8166226.1 hypothetical protein [Candidatus Moeniiplasma glomeromycotorum]MCE8166708.1 hypothetical protein [Candidatus Moeniiplasma glomeromycotorum]
MKITNKKEIISPPVFDEVRENEPERVSSPILSSVENEKIRKLKQKRERKEEELSKNLQFNLKKPARTSREQLENKILKLKQQLQIINVKLKSTIETKDEQIKVLKAVNKDYSKKLDKSLDLLGNNKPHINNAPVFNNNPVNSNSNPLNNSSISSSESKPLKANSQPETTAEGKICEGLKIFFSGIWQFIVLKVLKYILNI